MEPGVVRKDAPPAETIERLHAVLDAAGFPRGRAIVDRWRAGEACHSCHLRFANYPLICSNGKGITPDLALASALAEFVERLQCRVDHLFTMAGAIHRLDPIEPAEWRVARDVAASVPSLAATDLAALLAHAPGELQCLPFVDVFGRRLVHLPYDVLCRATGSNGMCAGNSPAEAIAHGICEVFERHVVRQLETGGVAGLPTIPRHRLRLESDAVRRQVTDLEAAGVEVVVKDGSLGGRFPVVGAVVRDTAAGTCHVSFGSDPCFDAALSRCLTEAFQGTARLFRRRPAGPHQAPTDVYNHLEVFAERLLRDSGEPCAREAFAVPRTNEDALSILLGQVRREGRTLYLRDFSVLGFPSYYVYVEGLSPLSQLQPPHLSPLHSRYHEVRRTLFALPWAAREDVAACASTLLAELTYTPGLEARLVDDVLAAPTMKCVRFRPLLALMLLEAGDGDAACALLDRPPLAPAELEAATTPAQVAQLLPSYARTREGRADPAKLLETFNAACGRRLEPAAGPARDGREEGGDTPPPILLPRCASVYHCPSCPCRRYCRLDEWHRLARSVRRQAVPVRQESLLEWIGSYRLTR